MGSVKILGSNMLKAGACWTPAETKVEALVLPRQAFPTACAAQVAHILATILAC